MSCSTDNAYDLIFCESTSHKQEVKLHNVCIVSLDTDTCKTLIRMGGFDERICVFTETNIPLCLVCCEAYNVYLIHSRNILFT